LGHGKDIHSR